MITSTTGFVLFSSVFLQFLYSHPFYSSIVYLLCTLTILPYVFYRHSNILWVLLLIQSIFRVLLYFFDSDILFSFNCVLLLFIPIYGVYITKFYECLYSILIVWLFILLNNRLFVLFPKTLYDICYGTLLLLLYLKVVGIYKLPQSNAIRLLNITLILLLLSLFSAYVFYSITAFDSSSIETRVDAFNWVDSRNLSDSVYTYHMDVNENASTTVGEYMSLIDDIQTRAMNESVSLKLQQFGTTFDEQVFNTNKVCTYASSFGIPCIISAYTENERDREFEAFKRISPNMNKRLLGLCIVVDYDNLTYVNERIDKVLESDGFVRLVKGAWYASSTQYITYYRWKKVSDEYIKLSKKLSITSTRHMLASHDPYVRINHKHINNSRWNIFYYTYPSYYKDETAVSVFYGTQNSESISIVNMILRVLSLRTYGF